MLTIFGLPKPFIGHIANIQRNAIRSWVKLRPECQVILFGTEEGTAATAEEFNIQHVKEIAVNEYGTPLVNDLFDKAQQLAENNLLCYANSDIILMSDFFTAVKTVSATENQFLMIGECWNLDAKNLHVNAEPGWEAQIRQAIRKHGESRGPWFIDYFVFRRGFYQNLPPFALGRAGFDNWLIWRARDLKAIVVDASSTVLAVHQNHDYSHVVGGKDWAYRGIEAKINYDLANGSKCHYMTFDATHYIDRTGLKRNFGHYFRYKYRLEYAMEWAKNAGWRLPYWLFMELTRPIRSPLGLDAAGLRRLQKWLTGQEPSLEEIKNQKSNAANDQFRWNKKGRSKDFVWMN